MQDLRLVPVLRAPNRFHAQVVAARLGAEGIVTQFRGSVEGPYPMGDVVVLVQADDLAEARELLLMDEVESVFAGVDELDDEPSSAGGVPRWVALGALVLLAWVVLGHLAQLTR